MARDGSWSPRLVNPYLDAPARPAVRVVTLGRLGLVAAGVMAVAAPADAAASTPEEGSEFALVLGDGPEVSASVGEVCMPGGYLLPSPPAAMPEGSPALID